MVRNQDHTYVHRHVDAWEKMGSLCETMAKSLRDAADAIAQRWPPERSQAAHAFGARLKILADAFEQAGHTGYLNNPQLNVLQLDNAMFHGHIATLMNKWDETQQTVKRRIREVYVKGAASTLTEDNLLAMSNMPERKEHIDRIVGPVPND